MEIFSILEEVFHHDLFPKLDWNDLLRLRRVSHQSKFLADGYLKIRPELAPEIKINDTDKSIDKFLELGIPTAKLYLNNNESGAEFYEKNAKTISTFLSRLGPFITHLRVDTYSYLISGAEWDFLDGLPNLISFDAKNCVAGDDQEATNELFRKNQQDINARGSQYPKIFKSLKTLSMDTGNSHIPGRSIPLGRS